MSNLAAQRISRSIIALASNPVHGRTVTDYGNQLLKFIFHIKLTLAAGGLIQKQVIVRFYQKTKKTML